MLFQRMKFSCNFITILETYLNLFQEFEGVQNGKKSLCEKLCTLEEEKLIQTH